VCVARHSQGLDLARAIEAAPQSIQAQMINGHFRSFALRCQSCQHAACVAACDDGAMRRDPVTGVVSIDQDRCTGCWACIAVCPSGALLQNENTGKALKCDLCDAFDGPACVDACPTSALRFEEVDDLEETVGARAVRG
jgi:anaerobic carbon-monoxide dehydrogenase iron sulfur subunit